MVRRTFEELFRQEYSRVAGVAFRVNGDRAEAEDVAQEVFMQFGRRHDPSAEWAPSWLHAAAAHTALNHIRTRRRREQRELANRAEPEAIDPAATVVARDEARILRNALARIPARQASVLVLRYSGLSYAEVAQAMGVKVSHVGTLLRRAEARLKEEVSLGTAS